MPAYNYKKGLTAMLGCFFIWGFQPLYWYLCGGMDTFFQPYCVGGGVLRAAAVDAGQAAPAGGGLQG